MDARVSGSAEVRPIRAGLVIPKDSVDGLRLAISIASASWGGLYYPIFEWASDADNDEILELSAELGVDVLLPCSRDDRLVALTETPGFQWLGFGDPFDTEHSHRPVGVDNILAARQRANEAVTQISVPSWDPADPLALLFAVMFGQFVEGASFETLHEDVHANTRSVPLATDAPVPADLKWMAGPLAIGSWRTGAWSESSEAGVAIIDPASVEELVAFWNLRAVGCAVVPWPVGHEARFEQYVASHLSESPLNQWGEDSTKWATTFVRSYDDEYPERLEQLLALRPDVRRVSAIWGLARGHRGAGGLTSSFTVQFDVAVTGSATTGFSIRIPVPQTGLLNDGRRPWQYCALNVRMYGQRDLRERFSFQAPGIRKLAPHMRWHMSVVAPFVRGIGEGVVIGCRPDEGEIELGCLDSTALIARLLEDAGYKVRLGATGLWSRRIIDLMGGVGSTIASQPAFRDVLDRASSEGGASAHELRSAASRSAGEWAHDRWGRSDPAGYPAWVMQVLAARRLLEAAFDYHCPMCGLRQLIDPDKVGELLRCGDCEAETPLAFQVLGKGEWRLKTRRLLTTERLRSTYPVLAALSLLTVFAREDRLHYAVGLELERAGKEFEIDFAALIHDHSGPVLVVAEVKARYDLDSDDVDNLEEVQDAVRALGVECYIAVANSKDALTRVDRDRLRANVEAMRQGIRERAGRAVYTTLPIILTRGPLTAKEDGAQHPNSGIDTWAREIDALARWTCERELGLKELRYWETPPVVVWTDAEDS